MWEFFTKLVEKVPARLVALLLSVTVGAAFVWFAVLAGAALFTNRDVQFFPPKIGTDPQVKAEVKLLSERVDQVVKQEQTLRGTLIAASISMRTGAADLRQKGQDKAADEYRLGADKIDAQIKETEQRLGERYRALEASLDQLRRQL